MLQVQLVTAAFEIAATVDLPEPLPAGVLWGTRFFVQTRQPGAYLEGRLWYVDPEPAGDPGSALAGPRPR